MKIDKSKIKEVNTQNEHQEACFTKREWTAIVKKKLQNCKYSELPCLDCKKNHADYVSVDKHTFELLFCQNCEVKYMDQDMPADYWLIRDLGTDFPLKQNEYYSDQLKARIDSKKSKLFKMAKKFEGSRIAS